jgi:thiamine-phosphate pyrophosphorylase
MNPRLEGVYVILDGGMMPDLPTVLHTALRAGIRLFQYREKRGPDRELLLQLYAQTQVSDAVLLVNDAVELAHLVDGVHLGQEDAQKYVLPELRRMLSGRIIGLSAHTAEQARTATAVDYLGVGPFKATASKNTARVPLGIDGVSAIRSGSSLPICAIGGIVASDIAELRKAGVSMAAVIGAIAGASDSYAAATTLQEAWDAAA